MKKNIALLAGGFSGESVISYKTAITIEANIDKEKYNVYKINITKEGWFYITANEEKIIVDKNDFSIIEKKQRISFDAVVIAIHGTPGEDGKLQGYFDLLNIPYAGCDAATAAITFNKRYAVAIAKMAGIGVAKSVHVFRNHPISVDAVLQKLHLPVFVKPNNGGSSIGMTKVLKAQELQDAVDRAFKEDEQVLIEEVIEGREFTVGVYRSKGMIYVLPITEVKAAEYKTFFDFEAKYEGHSTEITPALVEDSIADKIRDTAKLIFEIFSCKGVVRIDFIYNEAAGKPYMLEINTIAGESAESIIPQQVIASGLNLKDFYELIIKECFS